MKNNIQINPGDQYEKSDGLSLTVHFITDTHIVTTIWGGTLKQAERFVFTKSQFETGINKFWTKKGEKFIVPYSYILASNINEYAYEYLNSSHKSLIQTDPEKEEWVKIKRDKMKPGDVFLSVGGDPFLLVGKGVDANNNLYRVTTDRYGMNNYRVKEWFIKDFVSDSKMCDRVWYPKDDVYIKVINPITYRYIQSSFSDSVMLELYDDLDQIDKMSSAEKKEFFNKQKGYFNKSQLGTDLPF